MIVRAQLLSYDVVRSSLLYVQIFLENSNCHLTFTNLKRGTDMSTETEQSKPSPLERFRRLARSVQSQSRWTRALQSKIADEHSKVFQINQESEKVLSFKSGGNQTFVFVFIGLCSPVVL